MAMEKSRKTKELLDSCFEGSLKDLASKLTKNRVGDYDIQMITAVLEEFIEDAEREGMAEEEVKEAKALLKRLKQ